MKREPAAHDLDATGQIDLFLLRFGDAQIARELRREILMADPDVAGGAHRNVDHEIVEYAALFGLLAIGCSRESNRRAVSDDHDTLIAFDGRLALLQKSEIGTERAVGNVNASPYLRGIDRSLNHQIAAHSELIAVRVDRRPALRVERNLRRTEFIIVQREGAAGAKLTIFGTGGELAENQVFRIKIARRADPCHLDADRHDTYPSIAQAVGAAQIRLLKRAARKNVEGEFAGDFFRGLAGEGIEKTKAKSVAAEAHFHAVARFGAPLVLPAQRERHRAVDGEHVRGVLLHCQAQRSALVFVIRLGVRAGIGLSGNVRIAQL